MGIFSYIYELCIKLAKHPKATWFLSINSFIESIFWPIPPDVMLCPMCLARPKNSFRYALITVVASVAGAFFGYYLGYFIYDPWIKDLIEWFGYENAMATARSWFVAEYGILMVFAGAFTPIPYKVIAISAGLVAAESVSVTGSAGLLNIFVFLAVSFVGRGLRFYLEAALIYFGGAKMEHVIRRYVDRIGWACVILIIIYILYKLVE